MVIIYVILWSTYNSTSFHVFDSDENILTCNKQQSTLANNHYCY